MCFFCGSLRKNQYRSNYEDKQYRGRDIAAQLQPALFVRLIKEVTDDGAKWTRQDESDPKEYRS